MASIHLLFTLQNGSIHDVRVNYSRSLGILIESLRNNPDVIAVKQAQTPDLKYLRVNRDGQFTYSRSEWLVSEALKEGMFQREDDAEADF